MERLNNLPPGFTRSARVGGGVLVHINTGGLEGERKIEDVVRKSLLEASLYINPETVAIPVIRGEIPSKKDATIMQDMVTQVLVEHPDWGIESVRIVDNSNSIRMGAIKTVARPISIRMAIKRL